ncbi:hypothetical protein HZ994_15795 [Akkermansiaceae bacterium]|nr:hypothetical protein HZ994_15795 [Akkermansiaceae bacterium]
MLETPRQLVARFERGEIDRMEFQALMSIHQRELLREIDEDHQNPLAAWLESRLAKASVKKLLINHTAFQIREVLVALSEAENFPLAKYIWNAAHPDIPLHCFFRIRRDPVFQILSISSEGDTVEVHLEIHRTRNRERITLTRDERWRLLAPSFPKAAARG